MHGAVICVPWRGGNPFRERVWEIVHFYYSQFGIPIFVADNFGDFSPSKARNLAALYAGDWSVVAFIDADCVLPIESLKRGFEHALRTEHVTLPWDHYYSMSQTGHELGMDSLVPIGQPGMETLWKENSLSTRSLYAPGGTTIIPRVVWDQIGGYDERFVGWGPEDAAMLISVGSFDRLSGPAYHFWHPSSRPSDIVSGPWKDYAGRQTEIIQRLIDEDREIYDFGGWGMWT